MKLELLHSITHDGQEYLPGLHELPDALAAQFLKYDWAAQPFVIAEAKAGAVREAPGPNLELGKPESRGAGVPPASGRAARATNVSEEEAAPATKRKGTRD